MSKENAMSPCEDHVGPLAAARLAITKAVETQVARAITVKISHRRCERCCTDSPEVARWYVFLAPETFEATYYCVLCWGEYNRWMGRNKIPIEGRPIFFVEVNEK